MPHDTSPFSIDPFLPISLSSSTWLPPSRITSLSSVNMLSCSAGPHTHTFGHNHPCIASSTLCPVFSQAGSYAACPSAQQCLRSRAMHKAPKFHLLLSYFCSCSLLCQDHCPTPIRPGDRNKSTKDRDSSFPSQDALCTEAFSTSS